MLPFTCTNHLDETAHIYPVWRPCRGGIRDTLLSQFGLTAAICVEDKRGYVQKGKIPKKCTRWEIKMHQTRGDMLFQLFGPYQTNFWTQPFGLWADFIFGFLVFLWFIEMLFHDGPEALFGVAMRVSMDSVQFRKLCSRQRGTRMCMYSTLITSDSGLLVMK